MRDSTCNLRARIRPQEAHGRADMQVGSSPQACAVVRFALLLRPLTATALWRFLREFNLASKPIAPMLWTDGTSRRPGYFKPTVKKTPLSGSGYPGYPPGMVPGMRKCRE